MTDEIKKLEAKRNNLYKKLSNIGDFRRGTISVNYRKCGKKNCACTKPNHPGHGPQFLWNTTIKGKSFAKNLKLGPELQKYFQENKNYQLFKKIYNEIIQINEKICDLRAPIDMDEKEADDLKKKLLMIFRKKLREK
jgi:hypothetical protein